MEAHFGRFASSSSHLLCRARPHVTRLSIGTFEYLCINLCEFIPNCAATTSTSLSAAFFFSAAALLLQ
jgi:hypothetical protein